MNEYITVERIKEYYEDRKREERKKKAFKLIAGITLIPVTAAAFFYLPSKIADIYSYYQSKQYYKKKQEEDDFYGNE